MSKFRHITWDEHAEASKNARQHLPKLVAEYFARARHLLAHDPDTARLHALRLATKRLRYSLELFRPCYGAGLATRIAGLRKLQQVLGEINDTAAAQRALTEMLKGASPQQARVKKFLQERGESKAREFRKHWTEVFDAAGQERWWTSYLTRHTRKPSRRP
jgi:CHAD domain-containing protein